MVRSLEDDPSLPGDSCGESPPIDELMVEEGAWTEDGERLLLPTCERDSGIEATPGGTYSFNVDALGGLACCCMNWVPPYTYGPM